MIEFLQKKLFFFIFIFVLIFNVYVLSNSTLAKCPDNRVPNPLDPDCTEETSPGEIFNRFIPLWPVFLAGMTMYGVAKAVIAIFQAKSPDEQAEGFRILIRTAIAVILGLSIWLIFYLLEQATGVDLIFF